MDHLLSTDRKTTLYNQNTPMSESKLENLVVSTRYRVAYPTLRPLPFAGSRTFKQPEIFELHGLDIKECVDQVLVRKGLLAAGEECAETCHLGLEGHLETLEPTVMVVLPWLANSKAVWHSAVCDMACDLQRLLKATKFADHLPRIEILAPERVGPVYIAAVTDTKLLPDWDHIRYIVNQRLSAFEATRNQVTTLGILHLGVAVNPKNNPVTIYITVERTSNEAHWHEILIDIENALSAYDCLVHMEHNSPELLAFQEVHPRGDENTIKSKAIAGNLIIKDEYKDQINIGDSIGTERCIPRRPDSIDCNPPCGTLGCYLEIKTESYPTWRKFALTNYHFLRPSFSGYQVRLRNGESAMDVPVPGSQLAKVDRIGWKCTNKSSDGCALGVESPARIKHNLTIWQLRQHITQFEQRVAKYGNAKDTQSLSDLKDELIRKIAFFMDGKNRGIKIIGVSGFGRRTNGPEHQLDWALIQIPPHRQGSNRLPNNKAFSNCYHSPNLWPNPAIFGAPLKEQKQSILRSVDVEKRAMLLPKNNQLKPVERVYKLGATTGLSLGEFSSFAWEVSLKDASHLGYEKTTEYVFVYNHPSEGTLPFSGPGDSGSVVFDDDGGIVGLLFRGHQPNNADKNTGYTFVTPIEYVINDIKAFFDGYITDIRVAQD
ncbi:hypothetical protein ACHAP5_011398 [Fusarium lateritium]